MKNFIGFLIGTALFVFAVILSNLFSINRTVIISIWMFFYFGYAYFKAPEERKLKVLIGWILITIAGIILGIAVFLDL